jgi:peptidyl-prolyl cis-trans isomerase D
MKDGEISGVVETEYGFHAVKIEGLYKDAEAEVQGRHDLTRELMMNIEAETKAAEIGKKLLEALHSKKTFEEALSSILATYLPPTPPADAPKKDDKDDKKNKDDRKDKKEPPKPKDPMAEPDAPKVEVATDLTADGTSPLGSSEALNIAYTLAQPGDVPRDLIKLDNGYAVLQLTGRKAPSPQDFDNDRERYSRALLAAKQQDALIAYVNRLRDAAKDKIKINPTYLQDKALPEESPE